MDKIKLFREIIGEFENIRIKKNIIYSFDIGYSLREIAAIWPNSISQVQEELIDKLVKKISINKKVWKFYDKDWKPIKREGEIELNYLKLIIVLLLSYFPKRNCSVDIKGHTLNQLNAVFHALELFKGNISDEVYNKLFYIAESTFIEELRK